MNGSKEKRAEPLFLMSYDIGSTGCKTCLYRLDDRLTFIDGELAEYELISVGSNGIEQNPDDWWRAMSETTRTVMERTGGLPIAGISFSAQMQGLVLVDKGLKALRPAMSYMDQRSGNQKARILERGLRIEGMNAPKLMKSLIINGAISASVKDPVWKYLWVKENEPEVFAETYKWLDVKDYLIARATGICTMTADSGFRDFSYRQEGESSRVESGFAENVRGEP